MPGSAHAELLQRYRAVRVQSTRLCEPLVVEDYGVQPMLDASPPKWHLAHTSWFFETFILKPFAPGFRAFHPQFEYLFNSYYNTVGEPYPRARRGLLSRPGVAEVYDYRQWVDERLERLVETSDGEAWAEIAKRIELGINHEQQHQELILTDLKYNLGNNPLHPAYREDLRLPAEGSVPAPMRFVAFSGGTAEIGAAGAGEFCFDNELPKHQVFVTALCPGKPTGHQRRVSGVRGSRRIFQHRAVVVRRLGLAAQRARGCAFVLAVCGRGLQRVSAGWFAATGSQCAGGACELLRGGCLCTMGGAALAHRAGVGTRGT